MRYSIVCLIALALFACSPKHSALGVELAHEELKVALAHKDNVSLFVKAGVNDKQTAIAAVEPIVFKAYGRKNIIEERPYEAYLIDEYWVLSGTLPDGMKGGTFLIIFSAKDGRVIKLTHGK